MSPDRRTVLKGLAAGGVAVVGGGLVARRSWYDDETGPTHHDRSAPARAPLDDG